MLVKFDPPLGELYWAIDKQKPQDYCSSGIISKPKANQKPTPKALCVCDAPAAAVPLLGPPPRGPSLMRRRPNPRIELVPEPEPEPDPEPQPEPTSLPTHYSQPESRPHGGATG